MKTVSPFLLKSGIVLLAVLVYVGLFFVRFCWRCIALPF